MNREKPPSIREAFDFAWMTFRSQFRLFTSCMLIFFGSWVILEMLVITGQRFGVIWWLATHISFFFIFAGLEVGFIRICLDIYDDKAVMFADIFREFRQGAKFFLVQLLYFAMVLVGLLMLIVPGAYFATKYTFYAYAFAEGNSKFKQSFHQSANISQHSMWSLFWFLVFLLLFNIVGTGILGVGLMITVPVSTLMKTYIYRHLNE